MQKQCASPNCDETFETVGARKFCDLHAAAKTTKNVAPTAEVEDTDGFVVSINLSEKQLDRIWSGATIEEKGLAIQTILDSQREEE